MSFVVIKVIEEESRDAGVQQGNRVVGGGEVGQLCNVEGCGGGQVRIL